MNGKNYTNLTENNMENLNLILAILSALGLILLMGYFLVDSLTDYKHLEENELPTRRKKHVADNVDWNEIQ